MSFFARPVGYSSSGGMIVPLAGGTYYANTQGSSSASAAVELIFNNNGTFIISASGTGDVLVDLNPFSPITLNWFSPTTAGIGSSYWIRFLVSGSPLDFGTTGVWISLSPSFQSWSYNVNQIGLGFQSRSGTWTVQIASDSGGSNIVTTGTYNMSVLANV